MKRSLDQLTEKYEHILNDLSKTNNELSRLYRELGQKIDNLEKRNEWLTELLQATRQEFINALCERNEVYRIVADFTYDWELWYDHQRTVRYCSPSCERVTGFSATEFIANPELLLHIVHPEDRETVAAHLHEDISNRNGTFNLCFRIVSRSGDIRWIDHYCTPINTPEGHYLGRRISNRDITEMKNTELKLEESLHEKELLLREIHHRIKNNLSIVLSMLDLQANSFQNEDVRTAFQESKTRIAAVALIHNLLYQSKDFSLVDMETYIQQLCTTVHSFCPHKNYIQFFLTAKGVFFDIDRAIPCGLIINELFTNSIKHAFPNRKTGTVQIALSIKEDLCTLVVSDNGIGVPPSFDLAKTNTFGLQLVTMLVQQLEGTMVVAREKGTTFTITFHVK